MDASYTLPSTLDGMIAVWDFSQAVREDTQNILTLLSYACGSCCVCYAHPITHAHIGGRINTKQNKTILLSAPNVTLVQVNCGVLWDPVGNFGSYLSVRS